MRNPELARLIDLSLASRDFAWSDKALKFIQTAVMQDSMGQFVTLCVNEDGTDQSWRNMGLPSNHPEHHLDLPPGYTPEEKLQVVVYMDEEAQDGV